MYTRLHPDAWCTNADALLFQFFGKHFDELADENFPRFLLPIVALTPEETEMAKTSGCDRRTGMDLGTWARSLVKEEPMETENLRTVLQLVKKEITIRQLRRYGISVLALHDLGYLCELLGNWSEARLYYYLALVHELATQRRCNKERKEGKHIVFPGLHAFNSMAHVARVERRLGNLDATCRALFVLGSLSVEGGLNSKSGWISAQTDLTLRANPYYIDQNPDELITPLALVFQ